MTTWINCPICGEPDMRAEPDGDEGDVLIHCTNLCCASNGGDNSEALDKKLQSKLSKLEAELSDEAPITIQLNADGTWEPIQRLERRKR